MRTKNYIFISILLCIHAAVTLAYFYSMRSHPYFQKTILDPKIFEIAGNIIARGDWFCGHEIFFHSPFYMYFCGILFKLFGYSNLWAVRFANLFMSLSAIFITYYVGKRWFKGNTGEFATILLCFYKMQFFYSGFLMLANSLQMFTIAFFMLILLFYDAPNYKKSLFLGIILGFMAAARGNSLLMGALFILVLFKKNKLSAWKKHILVFAAGVALVILPITARNYIVTKKLVLLTGNAGVLFWSGIVKPDSETMEEAAAAVKSGSIEVNTNYFDSVFNKGNILLLIPAAAGIFIIWLLYRQKLSLKKLGISVIILLLFTFAVSLVSENFLMYSPDNTVKKFGEELEFSARNESDSGFWLKRSIVFLQNKSHIYIKNVFYKTYLFFNRYEYPHNYDIAFMQQFSPFLRLPFVTLRIISPLALCGLFLYAVLFFRQHDHYIDIVAAGFGIFTFSITLFFMTSRFRFPLIPVFALFAGIFLSNIIQFVKNYNDLFLKTLPAFFLAALSTNWPVTEVGFSMNYFYYGLVQADTGDIEGAKQSVLNSIIGFSQYDKSHRLMGELCMASGDYAEALKFFRNSLKLKEIQPVVLYNMGYCYIILKEWSKAAEYFERGLHYTEDPMAYYLYGNVLWKLRDEGKALWAYEKAESMAPDYDAVLLKLARIYYDNHLYKKVYSILDKRLSKTSGAAHSEYLKIKAELLIDTGNTEEAEKIFREVASKNPDDFRALFNIALLNTQTGYYDEAAVFYEKARKLAPENVDLLYNYAVNQMQNKKNSAAVPLIKKAAELAPDDFQVQLTAADICYAEKEYESALEYYQKANSIDSSHYYPYRMIGFIKYHESLWQECAGWWKTSLKRNVSQRDLSQYLLDMKEKGLVND